MTMSRSPWHNPVRVHVGPGCLDTLAGLCSDREPVLVTSPSMHRHGYVERLEACMGRPFSSVWSRVSPNPTIASCTRAATELDVDAEEEIVVALGGGSVMDTAKCVCARAGIHEAPEDWLASHLGGKSSFTCGFFPAPLVAIPTTAGTGSEVTMWATVWDEDSGKKHSLSDLRLYPVAALLAPELTISLPAPMTVFTALDAMSHAMESIWNRNANPVSETLALRAIQLVHEKLEPLLVEPGDLDLRSAIQLASLLAGLAFSSTRTALAHSISYPLTAALGIPHGLACSFTLAEVLELNSEEHPRLGASIARALGARDAADAVETLYGLFERLDLAGHISGYVNENGIAGVEGAFITPGRADNNLVAVDEAGARELMMRAFTKLRGTDR